MKQNPIPLSVHEHNNQPSSQRILELNSFSIGRLHRELNWTLGEAHARGVLMRAGLACGLNGEMCEGWANLTDVSAVGTQSEYVFETQTSTEAEEVANFSINPSTQPRCWFLTGLLSGSLSKRIGHSIYVLETRCRAKGDSLCRFVGKSREKWSAEYASDLRCYSEENIGMDLRTARELFHTTKERFQNLFELAAVPLVILDPSTGHFLEANLETEKISGHTRDMLTKMTFFDICHPADHHQIVTCTKSWIGGETSEQEIRLVRKDGNERSVTVSGTILSYLGKKVLQITLRDVTDLKVASQKEKDLQAQLLRSDRLSGLGRLAAGVAHEIKNPLGAIRNAIYYIRQSLGQHEIVSVDPRLGEIMNLAEEEIDGAVAIIEDLLDFSQVVRLLPRRTQINEILDKIPSLLRIPDNIELVFDLDVTLPSSLVDPDRLKQVFSNILTNAIQAMPQGGKITVRTRYEIESKPEDSTSQELIAISFEDTGVGISPHYLKKIFEPLFTTKARGTGLGLAISHNIVEKHGGNILVTSQPGKGSCFTLKIPVHTTLSSEDEDYANK